MRTWIGITFLLMKKCQAWPCVLVIPEMRDRDRRTPQLADQLVLSVGELWFHGSSLFKNIWGEWSKNMTYEDLWHQWNTYLHLHVYYIYIHTFTKLIPSLNLYYRIWNIHIYFKTCSVFVFALFEADSNFNLEYIRAKGTITYLLY